MSDKSNQSNEFEGHSASQKDGLKKVCVQEFRCVQDKFNALHKFFEGEKGIPQTIIFCRRREIIEKLAFSLKLNHIPALPIATDNRDMLRYAISKFNNKKISVLVVPYFNSHLLKQLVFDMIIFFELPDDVKVYQNWIGACQKIISFVDVSREGDILGDIKELIEQESQVPESLNSAINAFKQAAIKIDKAIPCTICLVDDPKKPVACMYCRQLIGCRQCVKKWCLTTNISNLDQHDYYFPADDAHQNHKRCPLCRTDGFGSNSVICVIKSEIQ